jgi:hypothetical protein
MILAAALLVTIASCGEREQRSSDPSAPDKPVTSEAAAASKTGTKPPRKDASGLDNAAENLQDLYNTLGQQQADVDSNAPVSNQPASSAHSPASRANVRAGGKQVQGPSNGSVSIDGPPSSFQAPAAQPEPPPRRVETVIVDKPLNRAELAFRLAERIRTEPTWSPMRQAVALMGLEMIEPGVGGPQMDDLSKRLSGDQATTARQLRKTLGEIASSESLAGDPTQLAGVLGGASRELAPPTHRAGLELGAVALCTRVESFGRYTPYERTRFLAGRSVPIIIYTEVEGFSQSEDASDGASRWTVQVSQELALYLDSDGSRQWRQAEQTVKDSSRSKRRDYYLVQRIDLPANLSVGKYNLKVIVRDRSPAAGNSELERTIPIEIVADAGITREP